MLRHSDSSQPASSSGVPAGCPAGSWATGTAAGAGTSGDPGGQVGCVQVVVKKPAHGLPPARGHRAWRGGRIAADEVVEAELTGGGLGQQVIIEQGDERLLRLGQGTAAQGGRGRQAEASARTDAQPPEELLMVGLQRTVGQIKGGYHLRGRRAGVTQPRRGLRQFVDQAAEARRPSRAIRLAVSWIASGSRPHNSTAAAI